jgi:hypothetical protein
LSSSPPASLEVNVAKNKNLSLILGPVAVCISKQWDRWTDEIKDGLVSK